MELGNLHPNVKAEYFAVSSTENPQEALADFRRKIKKVMSSNGVYMLANYHTGAMYPIASGHFSPVVAYHEATDSVLIMDVAGHLGTWVWVKVEELYNDVTVTDREAYDEKVVDHYVCISCGQESY